MELFWLILMRWSVLKALNYSHKASWLKSVSSASRHLLSSNFLQGFWTNLTLTSGKVQSVYVNHFDQSSVASFQYPCAQLQRLPLDSPFSFFNTLSTFVDRLWMTFSSHWLVLRSHWRLSELTCNGNQIGKVGWDLLQKSGNRSLLRLGCGCSEKLQSKEDKSQKWQ